MLGVMNPVTQGLREKFVALEPWLDERTRKLWAAVEARAIGRGGISSVAQATGMLRDTVRAGLMALDSGATPSQGRRRSPGGGRKALTERDPGLVDALEWQLHPVAPGAPKGPLRWTCSSAARLAQRLRAEGHPISECTVNRLLHALGYRMQGRGTLAVHLDRYDTIRREPAGGGDNCEGRHE